MYNIIIFTNIYIYLGCGHHVYILYLELSINSSFDFSSADGDDHRQVMAEWAIGRTCAMLVTGPSWHQHRAISGRGNH